MMGYIDYINRIWVLNRMEPFTPSERELLFYLLNECNTQYWKMPVRCPTSIVCATLGLSKMSIMRARDQLKERGLISYTEGVRNSKAPLYTITINDTSNETTCATTHVTTYDTTRGTTEATLYKNKERKENTNNYKGQPALCLDELELHMKNDTEWHRHILDLLAKKKIEVPSSLSLVNELEKFFDYLRSSGYKARPEDECRTHFYNKIKKELSAKKKNQTNGTYEPTIHDKRRSCGVQATSPQDYEASF